MEIIWRKIQLEDKGPIENYLRKKTYRSCEQVFSNLYLWNRFFPVKYAIFQDTLVFALEDKEQGLRCTFPIGEADKIFPALQGLSLYFQEEKKPMQLYLVQEKEMELLEACFPGRFQIVFDRDVADYVYDRESLAHLAGKKLHGKRNHINNFKKNHPDWVYEKITKENVEDCFQMALQWRQDHGCEEDEEKRAEMCVTLNALRLLDELGLVGGLIRIDGKVAAFSIGEPLNEDTFVVHIEKAFADIQGAYPMINQQFVLHETEGFAFVNREEDTGAEGLRKAKLSYYPAFLVNKGFVSEKGGNCNDKD